MTPDRQTANIITTPRAEKTQTAGYLVNRHVPPPHHGGHATLQVPGPATNASYTDKR
jgi:hypothetical protein